MTQPPTQEEALLHEGRELADACGAYIEKLRVRQMPNAGPHLDQRWISIGATHLQQGFMAVQRGINQQVGF